MTPGISSISAEIYHASDAVSNSRLKWIAHPKTPAHYKAKWIDKLIPDEESDALRIGSLTHRSILEPETMEGSFHVRPEGLTFSTKEGKAWRDSHQDRPILSAEESIAIRSMRESVWAHPVASRILKHSDCERSAFAEDKGLLLKSRFDALPRGVEFIADLKTCIAADLDSVQKTISQYGLFRQAAFYLKLAELLGMDRSDFVFIFVEKTPPYAVAVYQLDEIALNAGRMVVEADLQRLRLCMERNEWPGYSNEVEQAGLPEWQVRQLEKEKIA
jgi:hypothetical protein